VIVLLTDFSNRDPYIGQIENAIARIAPDEKVINLFSALPAFDIQASAYLLPAYRQEFSKNTIFLVIVDPGVGGSRLPVIVNADSQLWIGPNNGLFSVICKRSSRVDACSICWKPKTLSSTFHGRDLFAPVAAMLATGLTVDSEKIAVDDLVKDNWPDDLHEVVYIDHYGNLMTGVRASSVKADVVIELGGKLIYPPDINSDQPAGSHTFSDVPQGQLFWYQNANGLVEIAANQGNAKNLLEARIGQSITFKT